MVQRNYNLIDIIGDEEVMPASKGLDLRLRSVRESYSGAQVSLRNICDGQMNGVQISLCANYALDLRGGQIAVFNSAERATGVQIGGFNLIEDTEAQSTTLQMGLLNFRLGKETPWYAKCLPGIALRFPKR